MAGKGQGRGRSRRSGAGRRGGEAPVRGYSRVARINEVLRQVLADEMERLVIADERLTMLTITAVEADPDYRRAKVLLSSLGDEEAAALADARPRLQAAVARQVRLKWTPTLSFVADPAVADGSRIEEILRGIQSRDAAATRPDGDGDIDSDTSVPRPRGDDPDAAGGDPAGERDEPG